MKDSSKQVFKLFKGLLINYSKKQKEQESFAVPKSVDINVETFKQEEMIEGIDYGLIEGYTKTTLLKPGAEKLCKAFGFSSLTEVINRLEDWENGTFAYEVKVILINKESNHVEAEGLGSCNNKENPFKDQDAFTAVNTILKTAKKRALVDAVLFALNASSVFTQDIEDLPVKNAKAHNLATERQLKAIFRIIAELDMTHELAKALMKEKYRVDHSKHLTKIQASDFIQDLLCLQAAYLDAEKLNEEYQNE